MLCCPMERLRPHVAHRTYVKFLTLKMWGRLRDVVYRRVDRAELRDR